MTRRQRQERNAAKAVAAASQRIKFGAVEVGLGVPADDHLLIGKVDGRNVRTEEVTPVQFVYTRNRGALAETV